MKKVFMSLAVLALCVVYPLAVQADTNGSEIQVTDKPDQLILQLGPQWAGVKFELRTDAGLFPVPVVVDKEGVLKMDLGGSKTYTLSCLASPVQAPTVTPVPTQPAASSSPSPAAVPATVNPPVQNTTDKTGIPVGQLVLYFGGISVIAIGFVVARYLRHRRELYDYDDDIDGDNDDE